MTKMAYPSDWWIHVLVRLRAWTGVVGKGKRANSAGSLFRGGKLDKFDDKITHSERFVGCCFVEKSDELDGESRGCVGHVDVHRKRRKIGEA